MANRQYATRSCRKVSNTPKKEKIKKPEKTNLQRKQKKNCLKTCSVHCCKVTEAFS